MNNIQFKFNEIMRINRRRKIELEEDIDNYRREKEVKRRREEQYENENFNLMTKRSIYYRRNIESKQTYEYRTGPKCK